MPVTKNATEVLAADADGIAKAAAILKRGGLVAVPTETVYGLAARADRADAVAKIYDAKGRPSFNPLIVHVRDVQQASMYAQLDDAARDLMAQYWPGPLTLVLPLATNVELAPAITAGLPTVALRAPAHPVMQQLLAAVTFPLAAPSANRSGYISPTTVAHVLETLDGRIDAVIDSGACEAGLESTIIAVREDGDFEQLRPGPIVVPNATRTVRSKIEAPGQLESHYAPGKPIRLNARIAEPDEFMIGFGDTAGECTLSGNGNLNEAAARLYDCLHRAAQNEKVRIAIAPIPDEGIGKAINDRLRRAATPAS
ncbi:L-threonylcarbamoyladenylate synthase [Altererythrobacter insulae]|nr:L-threonylcarbamoyladenylate synthase [Altererythrobacter insulae]